MENRFSGFDEEVMPDSPARPSFRGDDRAGRELRLVPLAVNPVVPAASDGLGGSVCADDLVCVAADPGDERNEPVGETASK